MRKSQVSLPIELSGMEGLLEFLTASNYTHFTQWLSDFFMDIIIMATGGLVGYSLVIVYHKRKQDFPCILCVYCQPFLMEWARVFFFFLNTGSHCLGYKFIITSRS